MRLSSSRASQSLWIETLMYVELCIIMYVEIRGFAGDRIPRSMRKDGVVAKSSREQLSAYLLSRLFRLYTLIHPCSSSAPYTAPGHGSAATQVARRSARLMSRFRSLPKGDPRCMLQRIQYQLPIGPLRPFHYKYTFTQPHPYYFICTTLPLRAPESRPLNIAVKHRRLTCAHTIYLRLQ